MYMHVGIFMYTNYLCVYIYMYTCICIYVYMYIYVYIHIHKITPIYIHRYVWGGDLLFNEMLIFADLFPQTCHKWLG